MAPLMLVMVSLLMAQCTASRAMLALLWPPWAYRRRRRPVATGTPMGFVAQLSVIALAGMIIRNAVIPIEEVDGEASGSPPRDAIVQASLHRARPILPTACAAIFGMLPIAYQVFWDPWPTIIGGLKVATVLTLTVLPCALALLLRLQSY